jgi:ABC-type phosphate transport system substrate-binding protein
MSKSTILVAVNPENAAQSLTKNQITDILGGKITS